MVFSGIMFLFYFLPVVLLLYFTVPEKFKNLVLLLSSLIFYAWGEPKYVILMIITILIGYFSGILITSAKHKKFWLVLSIVLNLSFLLFFKYTDFFISGVNLIIKDDIPLLNLALPIGISFYTFQTLSYSVDIYRGSCGAQKNIINFGTYISMFPQLVAGPIVRYTDIKDYLGKRTNSFDNIFHGIALVILGLVKKVLIANTIGALWENVSSLPVYSLSVLTAWLGIIGFTLQIYFDFSGYSDMAIGLGKILGFEFLQNFNYPYISKSITEFWRRWHISLGTWFKEYVYIPLGGNRKGILRNILNLVIVWTLTGLWHGASLNFLVWGLYYAVILILEKLVLGKYLKKAPSYLRSIYTLLLVVIGWVFFASSDLDFAVSYLFAMIGGNKIFADGEFVYNLRSFFLVIVTGIIASTPYVKNCFLKYVPERKKVLLATILIILGFILSVAYLVSSTYNPFLYFRF